MNETNQAQPDPPASGSPKSFDYAKRLDEITAMISGIVRSSSLGLIAVAWLGLSATNESAPIVTALNDQWLLVGAGLSLFALFCDFLQYVSGYIGVSLDRRAKATRPQKGFFMGARFFFFYAKIVAAFLSSLAVIVAASAAALGYSLRSW